VTALAFAAVKVSPVLADAYSHTLGYLAWPAKALLTGAPAPRPMRVLADPTDLLALPALGGAWLVIRFVVRRSPRA
jgi:hypothetical protein